MERMQLFGERDAGVAGVRKIALARLAGEIARSTAAIGRIAVEGEVVRPTRHPGGTYFTLKDRAAQMPVRCPAKVAHRCRAVAGERVQVTGSLTWLSDRGLLQLVAEEVVPVGAGAIAALLAEVRGRLAADGLLDRPRRRIPRLPAVIGVVCGTEAAVRADIESVVATRFPGYPVRFRSTNVSGPGAAEAIADAMRALDRAPDVDVIVLARGGGDAAQLLPWSEEGLCRAVCDCATPVVSAIGHDADRPLCDEVADLRCGTPSLAAAAVVPDRAQLHAELAALAARAESIAGARADRARARLGGVRPAAALERGVVVARDRCGRAAVRMALVHPRRQLNAAHASLGGLRRQLDALAPSRVLERGYAVVRRAADRSVVRDAASVSTGDALDVQVAVGRIAARVEGVSTA